MQKARLFAIAKLINRTDEIYVLASIINRKILFYPTEYIPKVLSPRSAGKEKKGIKYLHVVPSVSILVLFLSNKFSFKKLKE
jgi:hypothetical protein